MNLHKVDSFGVLAPSIEQKASELLECIKNSGILPGMEQFHICETAMRYLGMEYKQEEELATGFIDCSTLTSQAHWEGALITMPFVADNQRTAISGITIDSTNNLEVADVLIKYTSSIASPNGKYNHVGLFLGQDKEGRGWVIEARGGEGVILSTLEEFDPRGGLKRFWLSRKHYDVDNFNVLSRVAINVPKFGRLGVRQYLVSSEARISHAGTDIYLGIGEPVYACTSGTIKLGFCDIEDSPTVTIQRDARDINVLYKNINPEVVDGEYVESRKRIGHVKEISSESKIRYSDAYNSCSHVHVEAFQCNDVKIKNPKKEDGIKLLNLLYLVKTNQLELPISV